MNKLDNKSIRNLLPYQQKMLEWLKENRGKSLIFLKSRGGGYLTLQTYINKPGL